MICICRSLWVMGMVEVVGERAMLLSAGIGVRMRPLTETRPKPLIEVNGKPLIEYALAKVLGAGIERIIVNVHHFPDQIEDWVKRQSKPVIELSDERSELLDTGGGIAFALPRLGRKPFFVLNSDSIWIENKIPGLVRLRSAWRDEVMDCLLLLCPLESAVGYSGMGDFIMLDDGSLLRHQKKYSGALVYIGAYLVHPRLFDGAPKGAFSMNILWDKAIASGRIRGIVHDGIWFHVGTPGSIAIAEAGLAESG